MYSCPIETAYLSRDATIIVSAPGLEGAAGWRRFPAEKIKEPLKHAAASKKGESSTFMEQGKSASSAAAKRKKGKIQESSSLFSLLLLLDVLHFPDPPSPPPHTHTHRFVEHANQNCVCA